MKYIITILLFCFSLAMLAQKERSLIRAGNEFFKQKKYDEAKKLYDEALKINPTSIEAKFNKADALYQQKKYEDAEKLYNQVADLSNDKNIKAKAYHNLGNALLKLNKFQESVDAYKKSLRLNPNDKDTKYNLSYAMNKLKQQQQQNKKDKKDDKNNKDQKDKNKDNKGDDQNKKENEGKEGDQKKKEAQPQKTKISKEQADQILKSLEGEEKKLQQKLLLQKVKVKKQKVEKDW